jgi:hypothetical protein
MMGRVFHYERGENSNSHLFPSSDQYQEHRLPNLDEIGKKVFEDETPLATKNALTFLRDPTSSLQSAEGDGLLLAKAENVNLSSMSAPWRFFPREKPEVMIELKMRGDHTDEYAVQRALLQRHALEFERRDKAHKQKLPYKHSIPIWFVSAHFPRWLEMRAKFNRIEPGCYRYTWFMFDWYWFVSNELPLEEALIPFLMTRDGEALDDFFKWVTPLRRRHWVLPIMKVFHMNKDFIREVLRLDPTPEDPQHKADWAEITQELLDQDPELKARLMLKAKAEGEAAGQVRTLKHLLELKVGRAMSEDEETFFTSELRRIGTEQISQLLMASQVQDLIAWLSPKK